MAQLVLKDTFGERSASLEKRIFTVGTESTHDLRVEGLSSKGILFTIIQKGERQFDCLPGDIARLRINGKSISQSIPLQACDRIEWDKGAAVFLFTALSSSEKSEKVDDADSLKILQELAAGATSKGALQTALARVLEYIVTASGAESAYLLSENASGEGWELSAAHNNKHTVESPTRKDLFSNTVLKEALARREPVCVDSLIGHPWSSAASVIASRIFSVACLPLVVDERIVGAVYLFTQTPGESIRKESLSKLSLVATQAALLLATHIQLRQARSENARLKTLVREDHPQMLSSRSHAMQEAERRCAKLAPTPLNVLLLGETGTGKEVVAKEIHRLSLRNKGPWVAVNCAAIPEALLESALFGHERGAFTGAVKAQPGKFALAHGGTLLLDEIGELPLELQSKLLRVLQEKQIEPVGAASPKAVDVRVIAATHQNLEEAVRSGKFRQDLYFRLNGATLRLPPLRERTEDILPLALYFLARVDEKMTLSPAAESLLKTHSWPGNVRELEQALTRAALLSDSNEILPEHLELSQLVSRMESHEPLSNLKEAQELFTRDYVVRALAQNDGNRAHTAGQLGISERSLYRLLSTDSPGREA